MKKATPALLLGGLALAACLQAHAAEPQATQPGATADTGNAIMVGIDARTGKLRPLTAAEARALSAKAANMQRQPVASTRKAPRTMDEARATQRRHANGAMTIRAPLSTVTYMQATRSADGRLSIGETQGDSQPTAPQSTEVSE